MTKFVVDQVIANGGESMNRVYKVKTFKALKGIVEDLYKEINSMLLGLFKLILDYSSSKNSEFV